MSNTCLEPPANFDKRMIFAFLHKAITWTWLYIGSPLLMHWHCLDYNHVPWAAEMNKVWDALLKNFEIKRIGLVAHTSIFNQKKDKPYEQYLSGASSQF